MELNLPIRVLAFGVYVIIALRSVKPFGVNLSPDFTLLAD